MVLEEVDDNPDTYLRTNGPDGVREFASVELLTKDLEVCGVLDWWKDKMGYRH